MIKWKHGRGGIHRLINVPCRCFYSCKMAKVDWQHVLRSSESGKWWTIEPSVYWYGQERIQQNMRDLQKTPPVYWLFPLFPHKYVWIRRKASRGIYPVLKDPEDFCIWVDDHVWSNLMPHHKERQWNRNYWEMTWLVSLCSQTKNSPVNQFLACLVK